jgi:hypothetical protein
MSAFFIYNKSMGKERETMDEMAQPQAVQTANQPDSAAAMSGGEAQINAPDTEQARSGAAETPFLTVRYNKQDKPLSREEAAVYAQKGMNYDKLSERLKTADEQIKTMSGINVLAAEYASQNGVTEAEALSAIKATLGGQDTQAVVNAQLDAFVAAHPDIDVKKLPEAVVKDWKSGVPLSEVYYAHEAKELGQKARELERISRAKTVNDSNAAASMGGAGGMGAAHAQPLTDEAIQSMSPTELEKNHARIWAYLTGQKS